MTRGIPERADIPIADARARLASAFERAQSDAEHNDGWEALWRDGFIPWDRRAPNPALADVLTQHAELVGCAKDESGRRRTALVPGCGRGYDVYLLAAHGWDAVGLEVSMEALKCAEDIRGAVESGQVAGYDTVDPEFGKGQARFVRGDFFTDDWKKELGMEKDAFDLIYDYTFLCALQLDTRPRWAAAMSRLLSPSGRLICLEFPLKKDLRAGGPPFALRSEVYLALLDYPCKNIQYDEDGSLQRGPGTSRPGPGSLQRIAHWSPERTHAVGAGSDMISVWTHRQ